jgi:hypothetical protein
MASSKPAFTRSHSSHIRGISTSTYNNRQDENAHLFDATAIASSSSSSSSNLLLHPNSSQASNIKTSFLSARSRTRSVGADGQSFTQQRNGPPLIAAKEISRGPGTPDITLDAFEEIKGRRDSPLRGSSRLAQTEKEDSTRKRSSSGEYGTQRGRPQSC